jgi:hypothetical protein
LIDPDGHGAARMEDKKPVARNVLADIS